MSAVRKLSSGLIVALTLALIGSACGMAQDDVSTPVIDESSEQAIEAGRFLSDAAAVLGEGRLSFAEHFSRRCQQLEGVHSPVDPLMSELDRFYSTLLVEDFQLTGAERVSIVDASPDQARAEIELDNGDTQPLELAFHQDGWHFDSCEVSETYGRRTSLLADGTPIITVDSDALLPIDRANAMIDSWVAGESGSYPWLSMRCRSEFTTQLTPSTAFELMAANGPDGFTTSDARAAARTGELLETLGRDRNHLLLPLTLELGLSSAGAEATTEDEVTVWVTIDDEQATFTTRWVEEAGNLYNDECDWAGAEETLDS